MSSDLQNSAFEPPKCSNGCNVGHPSPQSAVGVAMLGQSVVGVTFLAPGGGDRSRGAKNVRRKEARTLFFDSDRKSDV